MLKGTRMKRGASVPVECPAAVAVVGAYVEIKGEHADSSPY